LTRVFTTENIFGVNLNYDDDFETLKNEVGKIGKLDYELIGKISLKILKEKSKDIRVFSFLGFALLRKEDWEGFSDVYEALAILFERDFDSLYPDRIRAKESALKWLSESRFMELVSIKKPESEAHDHITRLSGSLARIRNVVESKFSNGVVFPEEFYKRVKSWEIICKPQPQKNPLLQHVEQKSETVSVHNSLPAQHTTIETVKQAYTQIKSAASFLIQKEPANPAGYRLMRCIRWDQIENAPPSGNGKTLLAGPTPQQRLYFDNLFTKEKWKVMLEAVESVFASSANHLWLDLQRFAVISCGKLGAEYLFVKDAIINETLFLVKRIPQILSLYFSDGTPFCDDSTKDFFISLQKGCFSEDKSKGENLDQQNLDKEHEEAQKIFAGKGYLAAIDYLQMKAKTCGNERENFIRSLTVASFLIKGSQPEIAVPVLEDLDAKAQEFRLDKWEPGLVSDLWSALIFAYKTCRTKKNSNQGALSEKINSTLCKLSRIDVVRACSINQ
jgi:type VI secretion system protein VasJ